MVYDLMNLVIFCYIVLENHNCFAYHLTLYYQPFYRYSLHECIRNDRTCTPSYFDISGAAIEGPLTLFCQKIRSAARSFKKSQDVCSAHNLAASAIYHLQRNNNIATKAIFAVDRQSRLFFEAASLEAGCRHSSFTKKPLTQITTPFFDLRK